MTRGVLGAGVLAVAARRPAEPTGRASNSAAPALDDDLGADGSLSTELKLAHDGRR
jgi:hypothetical protein